MYIKRGSINIIIIKQYYTDVSAILLFSYMEAIMEIEPTAYGLNISPANDYLIYRLPGAPADGVRILDLETGEMESLEVPGSMITPQKGRVAFSREIIRRYHHY